MKDIMKCSKCGSYVEAKTWYDDYWLVEYVYSCPNCGYSESWAYGQYYDME